MRRAPFAARDYRLENVFRVASAGQRAEAVAFWLGQGALLNQRECERRTTELVYLVRRPAGELAGMSTAALVGGGDGRTYYAFRMFLCEEDRVPYLMRTVYRATFAFLRDREGAPAGMIIVTENLKLMRPGIRRSFQRKGLLYRGKNARGLDVWLAPFDAPPVPATAAESRA